MTVGRMLSWLLLDRWGFVVSIAAIFAIGLTTVAIFDLWQHQRAIKILIFSNMFVLALLACAVGARSRSE